MAGESESESGEPDGGLLPAEGRGRQVADALAWGAVSGLSFLVLAFGYRIVTSATPDVAVLFAVAAAVAVAGGVVATVAERRLSGLR